MAAGLPGAELLLKVKTRSFTHLTGIKPPPVCVPGTVLVSGCPAAKRPTQIAPLDAYIPVGSSPNFKTHIYELV